MVVESACGLGQALVSGQIEPHVFKIDRATGNIRYCKAGENKLTAPIDSSAEGESQKPLSLDSKQLTRLWQIGTDAQSHFGRPVDIEWAIANGRIFVLQSRPITTLEIVHKRRWAIAEIKADLKRYFKNHPGPLVMDNLGQTLNHPTPFTWSLFEQFRSATGGMGNLHRQVGFVPADQLKDQSTCKLVGGQIYLDTSLVTQMFQADFPYRYDRKKLEADPDASQSAPSVFKGNWLDRWRADRLSRRVHSNLSRFAGDMEKTLHQQLQIDLPAWLDMQQKFDLPSLDATELVTLFESWRSKVMDELLPATLLPTMILQAQLGTLRQLIEMHFWDKNPPQIESRLLSLHPKDKTVLASEKLHLVADGALDAVDWLAEFGHRGPAEMELARPRWNEMPDQLLELARNTRQSAGSVRPPGQNVSDGDVPSPRHSINDDRASAASGILRHLLPRDRTQLEQSLAIVHTCLRWREDGKYHFLKGYALLRLAALEAGRRLNVGNDIFQLSFTDLILSLQTLHVPVEKIAASKSFHQATANLRFPHVIDAQTVDQIDSRIIPTHQNAIPAFPISPGIVQGHVRIIHDPLKAIHLSPTDILVCPSTD